MFQFTIWSIPPLAAAILSLIAFGRVSDREHIPGGKPLRFLFLTLFLWAGPLAAETMLIEESNKIIASKLAYLGIVLTPLAWFHFALTYSRQVLNVSKSVRYLTAVVPLLTLVCVWTNEWHRFFWTDWVLIENRDYTGLVVERGLGFTLHALYSYALLIAATAILIFSLTQFKLKMQAIVAAIGAPMIVAAANIYSLSSYNPSPWLDFTTLGFFIAILILDRGILAEGLLENIPVVRDRVVELLKDPVVVVSHDGAIIDANQSAIDAWAGRKASILQQPISSVIEHLPLAQVIDPGENSIVTIDRRAFEVAATPLSESTTSHIALLFRDVTERQETERQLREVTSRLNRMAHTDVLTDLFNRRYFIERLEEEFDRISRHGSSMSVLIYDLDHFKRINDTYGHDAGDRVLKAVSKVTNQVKRSTDIACRLGGEEFALLLPETDKKGAIHLAQRLRREIESFPYHETTDESLTVTASVGVATVKRTGKDPQAILKTADRALYKAKNGGRNMVCYDTD